MLFHSHTLTHCSMLTQRMAMRRMNEMWRRMALTLVFYALLFQTCQSQDDSLVTSPATKVTTSTLRTQNFTENVMQNSTGNSTEDIKSNTSNTVNSPLSEGTVRNTVGLVEDSISTTSQTKTIFSTEGTRTIQTTFKTSRGIANNVPNNDEKKNGDGTNGITQMVENKTSSTAPKSAQNVLVPTVVCGLILAAALIGVYIWKNPCFTKASGMKLAGETYIDDEANQGNTLVSVAPLNPPESPEKTNQNGESLEAVKSQNPPAATNGHSTSKADTEL